MAVLYKNGVIVTMAKDLMAEALIEKEGRIVLVGSLDQARNWQAAHPQEKLEERDLAGHTMLPGFIDPHSHITALAQTVNLVHFDDVASIGELQKKIRDFLIERQLPEGAWIQGFGYDHNFLREKRHPTRAELDAVSESHPILIAHASGHMGVVNSAALKQLGIDASTRIRKADGSAGKRAAGSLMDIWKKRHLRSCRGEWRLRILISCWISWIRRKKSIYPAASLRCRMGSQSVRTGRCCRRWPNGNG